MGGVVILVGAIVLSIAVHVGGFGLSYLIEPAPKRIWGDERTLIQPSHLGAVAPQEVAIEIFRSEGRAAQASGPSAEPAPPQFPVPSPAQSKPNAIFKPATQGDIFPAAGARVAMGVGDVTRNPDDDLILCDEKSKQDYEEIVRQALDDTDMVDFAKHLAAEQRIYVCRVYAIYPDDTNAIFLGKLGIRLTNLFTTYVESRRRIGNHGVFCEKFQKELSNFVEDLLSFEAGHVQTPNEFKRFQKGFETQAQKYRLSPEDNETDRAQKCDLSWSMFNDAVMNGGRAEILTAIDPDLCAWRKAIEGYKVRVGKVMRTYSTAGFPKVLNDCEVLFDKPAAE